MKALIVCIIIQLIFVNFWLLRIFSHLEKLTEITAGLIKVLQ